jgi:hypothetical protein
MKAGLISIAINYGPDDRGIGFRFLAGAAISFFSTSRSARRPTHRVFHPTDDGGCISGGKADYSSTVSRR